MEDNNWYVYRHLKPCGEVFYIGIGNVKNFKRAFEKGKRRSIHWRNKVKKYPNYEVQILTKGLTKEEAAYTETVLISWYGRLDLKEGTLVNMTDGGDGTVRYRHTKEQCTAISQRMKGKERPDIKGEKNPNFGKFGEKHHLFGVPCSEERKRKISSSNIGKKCSEKNKELYRKLYSGGNSLRAERVVDISTGVEYGCIKDACKELGLSYTTIRAYLKGRLKNKSNIRYLIDYINER